MASLQQFMGTYDDIGRLSGLGYVQVSTTPTEPGQFQVVDREPGAGWAEYWYALDIYEDPERPLSMLGWGVS